MCFSCFPPPSPYFPRRLQQYQLLVLREMSHMHTYIYIYIYCVMSHICLSHTTCMIYIADVHHTHVMHTTQNVTHIYIYTYMCIYIFICLMSRIYVMWRIVHIYDMWRIVHIIHICIVSRICENHIYVYVYIYIYMSNVTWRDSHICATLCKYVLYQTCITRMWRIYSIIVYLYMSRMRESHAYDTHRIRDSSSRKCTSK